MADFDLLVLGDCNPDVILHGGSVEPAFGQAERLVEQGVLTIGGSGAITACGAARLGLRTALVAVVGDDRLGRLMVEMVGERGVDVSGLIVVEGRPTGLTVALSRGVDRAILTAPGTLADLAADQVDRDLLRAARHVHVSSYFLQTALRTGLAELLGDAHAAGATTSVDPNWDPSDAWDGGLGELLGSTDVFLPNEAEARRIAGRLTGSDAAPDLEAAAATLAERCPVVAVKLGSDGALLRQPRERGGLRVPGVRIGSALLDSTGAGDSFDAGFLRGALDGMPLRDALRLACACGALSTRALGGTDAQPTMDEAVEVAGIER